MSKGSDLIGKTFFDLTVIAQEGKNEKHDRLWLCRCVCGNTCIKRTNALTFGSNISCGCRRVKQLTGIRYGRLVVIEQAPSTGVRKRIMWRCLCDCGKECVKASQHLCRGHTRSCGCLARETTSLSHNRGGYSGGAVGVPIHPLYRTWRGLRVRCNCVTDKAYPGYGGRGIKVCSEWDNSFEAFLLDILKSIGPKPGAAYSLDRIDNNGNYEPGNVRWATSKEQNNNRRTIRDMQYRQAELEHYICVLMQLLASTRVTQLPDAAGRLSSYGLQYPMFDNL